ncbi:MAG TPA: DUF4386 family protein [Pyrinomonadaceae bacterium]|jgi:hypothetical protein|nr:DUF4386 family protein [Pyrinomonadaceae bacterium]
MTTDKAHGRRIGLLLIGQMAAALIFPFVLINALVKGYPDFLTAAPASAGFIRGGVALGVVGAAFTLALAVAMLPVLRQYSRHAAILFIVVCGISSALDLVHNASVLSMLGAAEQLFAKADANNIGVYQAWGAAAASFRRSIHIMQLVAIAGWMSTFYVSLFRYRIIPRALALLGIAGIVSQFVGVTLMMFLGDNTITYLAIPLAPIQLIVAGYLIVRGARVNIER